MSCFIVSEFHVEYLVSAWAHYEHEVCHRDLPDADARAAAALMLETENHRSYVHRYMHRNDNPPPPVVRAPRLMRRELIDPVWVLKSIACYEYQACETPDWPESQAYEWCQALRLLAINALPGYDDAPWGIDSVPGARKDGGK